MNRTARGVRFLVLFVLIAATLTLLAPRLHFWSSERKSQATSQPYTGPGTSLLLSGNGYLDLADARAFCQHRRWGIWEARSSPRRVYDMFLFNTELDWLDIRLRELADEVDYFVILESDQTFQETAKPLHLKDNLERYSDFKHKIIHHTLNASQARIRKGDTWEHERFTRNALLDQALLSLDDEAAPSQGDVLVVGDIDEIPRRGTLKALRNCAFPARVTLRSQMYYYSFQWLHRGHQWHHPQATYFDGPDTIRPEDLRSGEPDAEMFSSAWHCSSCFRTLAELQTKIRSFSHNSYNQPYFLEDDRLLQKVTRGEDLFDRADQLYDRVDANPDIPTVLQSKEGREKYAYMLDRDPPNGNFQDVP